LSADITAAGLTVTGLSASNKTYDGGTGATLSGTAALSGVVAGDTVSLTGTASGAFATASVGTNKPVTVSGLSLTGAQSGNYALTQPTLSADITAAGLTVTGITADSKVYDGTTAATLNFGSAAFSGVVGGDTLSLVTASASGSFATSTVGAGKTVAVIGLEISGAAAGNYTLEQPTASANITAATLTVTADSKTRPYGYANPALTAAITGFVGGENSSVLAGAPALSTGANAASVPGAYTITTEVGTLSAQNYTFSFVDGTLTVRTLEMADWEDENFDAGELLDPDVSGPDADPDADGVINLNEYAFGTDPKDNMSGPFELVYSGNATSGYSVVDEGRPRAVLEVVGGLTTTRGFFLRRKTAYTSDLAYAAQFSSNGTTWVTSVATLTVLADDGLYELVSVPYPLTTGGKKTRFFQVVPSIIP
jgi:hypothetical protein